MILLAHEKGKTRKKGKSEVSKLKGLKDAKRNKNQPKLL
jgi:hypothetical protein